MSVAERTDCDRIVALFAELGQLTQREIVVRRELTQLLDQRRSPAANAELSKRLQQRFGKAQR